MSNNLKVFELFNDFLLLLAAFCLGFTFSLCLKAPKGCARCSSRLCRSICGSQVSVTSASYDRCQLDHILVPIESNSSSEDGHPVPISVLQPCCRILLFPDDKLPCYCYYKSLITTTGLECRGKRQGKRIHRSDTEKSCLIEMMKIMSRASRIDICMMNLSCWEMADFLRLLKHELRTKIRIVTDDGKEFRTGTRLPWLMDRGVEVRMPASSEENATSQHRGIMHHKFAVVDNQVALLGSLNWTEHGVLKNRESVLISRSELVASALSKEFEFLWKQSRDATAEDFE